MNLIAKFLIVCAALLSVGCQALGPKPDITSSDSEIKALKDVQKILVMPTLGTGSNDPEKDLNKTVPAGAFQRYGDNMVLASGLGSSLGTLSFEKALATVLPINWQVEFYRWVKEQKGAKPAKGKMQLKVPTAGKRVAASDKDLKKLAKALAKRKDAYEAVAKVMETNSADAVAEARDKNRKNLAAVENLLRHLMSRLDVSYVLVSYLDGSQESFDKDLPVTLHLALVNRETGKMRYYSQSSGKKSDLPTTFEGLYSMMVINFIDAIAEFDQIDY